MKRSMFASVAALTGVAACATPGIDYEARLMASSPDAAATRTVQVDRFRGPAGGWYADRFEAMLANTVFDGQAWFQLADVRYGDINGARAGSYSGDIDIESYTYDSYTRTVSKCVEWDGLFDCERREDVEEECIVERVEVSVTPRLIDAASGHTIFSGTYGGDAERKDCHEIDGHYGGYVGGRSGGLFGFGASNAPAGLVRSALSKTLYPIRVDIAPRNATVRATFVTDALDPVVAADPRFEQALKISSKDPFAACNTWTEMAADYPQAPAIVHNMGACAEASSDFTAAQGLYAKSAELSVKFSDDGITAPKPFLQALRKLSEQRFGLELIDEVSGREDRVPVAAVPEG